MKKRVGTLLKALAVFLLYFSGAWLSMKVRAHGGNAFLIWIPGGVGFTCLLLGGLRLWPAVFLAGICYLRARGHGLLDSAYVAVGLTLDALVSAGCMTALGSRRPTFVRLREIFALLGAVVAGSAVATSWVLAGQYLHGVITAQSLPMTARMWFVSDVLGNIVIGGFVLHVRFDWRRAAETFRKRRGEAIALAATIAVFCAFIFTRLAAYNHSLLVRPYFMFAIMLWACLRFDVLGAVFLNLATAVFVIAGALQQFTQATPYSGDDGVLILQYVLLTLGLVGLVLGAEEREKRDAIEARNEFLGIASHELKTPITSIKLQLQLFQKRLAEGGNPDAGKFLGRLDRQLNRLTRIVNLLLDISRVDRGDRALQVEPVFVHSLVAGVVDRLGLEASRASCTLTIDVPENIAGLWDAYRIEQVLENLVSNAIKYAPGTEIQIRARFHGAQVELAVADGGPGIPLERQALLFERFYRAFEKSDVQGLGLGLYLSRQIVEAHGGQIALESREGHGTIVRVRLPAAKALPAPQAV